MDENVRAGYSDPSESMELAELMISSLLQGKGLKYLIDICCDLLENPVILCGPGSDWFVYSSKYKLTTPDLKEMLVSGQIPSRYMDEHVALHTEELAKAAKPFLIEEGLFAEARRLALGINLHDQLVAILTVFEDNRPFTQKDYGIVEFLGSVISNEIRAKGTPQSALYEYQLQNMLVGEPATDKQRGDWLASLKWRASDGLCLCVIQTQEAERHQVEAQIRTRYGNRPNCKVTRVGNNIVLLGTRLTERVDEATIVEFRKYLSAARLHGATSTVFYSLDELPNQYILTCEAVEIATIMKPGDPLVRYEEVAMFALAHRAAKTGDIACYIAPQIKQLRKYDDEYGTEFCQTLRTYLLCGRTTAAAERLCIHKNTLKYRLERIAKIVDINLADQDALFVLRQSVYIEQYLEKKAMFADPAPVAG